MNIEQKVQEYKENLDFFEDELDKYEYLIDLGKKLPSLEEKHKVPKNLVHGCTSQVWLKCEKHNDTLIFKGDSDALIVKGLVYLILDIFSEQNINKLQTTNMDILYELNLSEVITPNRQSGVMGMIKKIKEYAAQY
jgi:cysteine desulfuration protein SufE